MKIRYFLIYIILICSLLGCKLRKLSQKTYDDIGFTIYNSVENYYYSYLKYPTTIDKLTEYLWERRLNIINNYRYDSFSEYYEAKDTNKIRIIEVENTINFLNKNKKNLSIFIRDSTFILDYCGKGEIEMNLNYCNDKLTLWDNKFSLHRFHTFDSLGKMTREDYSDEFNSIQTRLIKKYPKVCTTTVIHDKITPKNLLIRYQRGGKFELICIEDMINSHNPYINELFISLDTLFQRNRNIESIVFLTPLFNK